MQFPAQYKNPLQLYKMIKNQLGIVQKCFSTSILVQGSPRETAYDKPTNIQSFSVFQN